MGAAPRRAPGAGAGAAPPARAHLPPPHLQALPIPPPHPGLPLPPPQPTHFLLVVVVVVVVVVLLLSHPQFPHHLLPLYDPSSDSWRRAYLSPSPSLSPGAPRLLCCSSSSGLLCFSFSLNPPPPVAPPAPSSSTTRSPTPPASSRPPRATWTSPAPPRLPARPRPHGYKLFVPAQDPARVFLYDSEADSWAQFPGFEPLLTRSGAHRHEGALFRGALFFATPEPPAPSSPSTCAPAPGPPPAPPPPPPPLPAGLAFARLVGGGGGAGAGERLFLVGGVGRDGITRSVCVWELLPLGGGGGGWRWAEAGRLPEMMCRKLVGVCYHNYAHVYCAWHGGGAAGAGGAAVCVCCATWPEVLAFRVGRATWHWLPRCPLLRDKWSCGFRWFSFAPDLYALV
uniref:Uncharacterized protein n=1 Tax=Ananas comosus var. bracteatus TaxID=296719 RepID=A0A6V7PP23_ANACO|nr:unnamed protein product [Ananas comosus var. bracteatus]